MATDPETTGDDPLGSPKMGLALSGGGFRASIFHLGVIRRLEELGLMKDIAVISAVSGGSIIAAYYVTEMEIRLRSKRDELTKNPDLIDQVRLSVFDSIATDFFTALDHNLRSRALVFSPFYHPIGFLKSLRPGYSRSDLMRAEYDYWLYRNNTLDQLPSVTKSTDNESLYNKAGPKLILNTTSLMTGERRSFSRQPESGLNDQMTVNGNALLLSQIVGASACVPGLFPPVPVSGELLVDGGVSDNQGIEALIENDCDILLVSDASGQMEQVDRQSSSTASVVGRTMSILQFQVRNKLLDLLIRWRELSGNREFAFIHLFMNLKDRPDVPRVPSEFIPGIARIRTDLDQFSFIEREALMYHGYTLIDAQIATYCPNLKTQSCAATPMGCPRLFSETGPQNGAVAEKRARIKTVLKAGQQKVFLARSIMKHGLKALLVVILTWLAPLGAFYFLWANKHIDILTERIGMPVLGWINGMIPDWVTFLFSEGLGFLNWPITPHGFTVLLVLGLLTYGLLFLSYLIMRRLARRWDINQYRTLTGEKPLPPQW
ncbi:MAG: patatin-like phospholipase family protein [Candidatus Latescibacteria bacterium]|nr:patatin-like phospholipase family protein [Candidatus Latescibacterota bacterium]